MTYSTYEIGKDTGTPIELYLFEVGGDRYAFNNTEQELTVGGVTYDASPVSRSRITLSSNNRDSKVTVTLPGDNMFSRLYIGVIPAELPEVTIQQYHEDDPDEELFLIFSGFASSVGFTDNLKKSDVVCSPLSSASGKAVPKFTFQALCNHSLYDDQCQVVEATYEETVVVGNTDDRQVTLTGLSVTTAGYWLGGFIQIGSEYRQIMAQASNVMTVDLPFQQTVVGQSARILPGCDHLIDGDCDSTYSNTVNHGGFPYVSKKNPFEGLD